MTENNFTDEEVATAKAVKQQMLSGEMPNELISIYMAGEICMWDELRPLSSPSQPEITQGMRQYGKDLMKWIQENCKVDEWDYTFYFKYESDPDKLLAAFENGEKK